MFIMNYVYMYMYTYTCISGHFLSKTIISYSKSPNIPDTIGYLSVHKRQHKLGIGLLIGSIVFLCNNYNIYKCFIYVVRTRSTNVCKCNIRLNLFVLLKFRSIKSLFHSNPPQSCWWQIKLHIRQQRCARPV